MALPLGRGKRSMNLCCDIAAVFGRVIKALGQTVVAHGTLPPVAEDPPGDVPDPPVARFPPVENLPPT